ncbi:MAG: molybdenum cofactor biosynthesis protein MoaE [Dehalococcoidia bacterium]|nr:molybdenum cofactor biosynthesis protein MoaE [Dehalococcoidia bacterium]
MFEIIRDPIESQALIDAVARPDAGGIALFLGVVRNNNLGRNVQYLEYDAYPPLAIRQMGVIAEEVRDRWDIAEVAMLHRIGRLEIGEASVGIAVSAAHRKEALEACHYAIDRLKESVPVWKKEVWDNGEEWIESCEVH